MATRMSFSTFNSVSLIALNKFVPLRQAQRGGIRSMPQCCLDLNLGAAGMIG
jgi:hypothetical protein